MARERDTIPLGLLGCGSGWLGPDGDIGAYIHVESENTLAAYRRQPNLIIEHANHEEDTTRGGYAHRQLFELVQNGADALARSSGGNIWIRLTPTHLYCADAGQPIDRDGVRALMFSRLSPKRGTSEIGRFGLGFKSVLGVTDDPDFFSRSGSFRFNREKASELIRRIAPNAESYPVLRLPEAIEPLPKMEADPILRELMDWAVNIVRLPLKRGTHEALGRQIRGFPPEFLLFVGHVSQLVLQTDDQDAARIVTLVQICRCRSCGMAVRGRHPDVAPDQYGASAHRVGRRVMAAAHVLHYGVGVPVRKVPAVLRALTGVELSQGAISQDALRRARGAVGDAYHKLRGSVRASPLVHTDDTGWRVDGRPAFLMAFETDEATVYQVRARHRNEEVREVVPSDYGGVMVTDRGRSYDAQALSGVKQQKCLAHVLRSISEVVQTKRGRGRSFGNRLSRLLREAMELRQAYHRGEAADFAAEAERLRREATYHLRDRPISDADNWRLQNELGWHDDRGNLLRFLDDPSIEPTNNRAERALRGAVIARKVSHCSKNVGGADAFSAFTSVIRTLARNGGDHSLVNGLCRVFSGAPVPTPSF